ncbi:NAD(P)/FAD-dependent oxidoreductase [Streptomyces sp. NPDC014889]|uniref:NAD(P)/FAD-dependent oxidoreductase n=1 Tax=Streptomyces sp. NPDC014889 TaxID=3364928 RepID=UPI0036FCA1CE
MSGRDRTRAVVIGAGVAGLLAAFALAGNVDEVTVIERDRLPDGPEPRAGAPQGHHAHVLLPCGAAAIDELVPGALAALVEAGAPSVGLPRDIVVRSPYGWLARHGPWETILTCTRGLIEWTLRRRLLTDTGAAVRAGTEVIGLLGGPGRVTGVLARRRGDGRVDRVGADLVVDASGHGSAAPRWLAGFGAVVRETVADSGVAYATRPCRLPAPLAGELPAVYLRLDMRKVSRGGLLVPVEDGRWLATLFGTRGAVPDPGADGHAAFARELPDPLIAQMLARAEPAGPVRAFRRTASHRRHYERMRRRPEGFVVLGDAACTFNPAYGQGVSVAALGALALREAYAGGPRPGTARRAQRAVARSADTAWRIAFGLDQRHPLAHGARPGPPRRLLNRYLDRLDAVSAQDPRVQRAMVGVYALTVPAARLLGPATLLAAARGPLAPPAARPPLTPKERTTLAGAGSVRAAPLLRAPRAPDATTTGSVHDQ